MLTKPNAKQIHFYEYDPKNLDEIGLVKHSWYDTLDAINIGVHEIHTTQMGLMDVNLWRKGYRIFVHSKINGETLTNELIYGSHNDIFGRTLNFRARLFMTWVQWSAMQFRREL